MRSNRAIAAIAIAMTTATAVAACGGGSSSTSTGSNSSTTSNVTLTWWNNATAQPLLGVWQSIAASFHAAHPNVTIKNVPIQNEQFTTKIPLALESSTPPDIYQQWGGGQEATQEYFDIAFPTQVGQNLDNAVADYFAGQGSAQSVISSVSGPA